MNCGKNLDFTSSAAVRQFQCLCDGTRGSHSSQVNSTCIPALRRRRGENYFQSISWLLITFFIKKPRHWNTSFSEFNYDCHRPLVPNINSTSLWRGPSLSNFLHSMLPNQVLQREKRQSLLSPSHWDLGAVSDHRTDANSISFPSSCQW